MGPLVSIAVPAYNVAPFVRESIDSVLAQTWREWELLIVDDSSTDDTFAICSEYAARDARISLRRQPNSGSGAGPRNTAIRASRGDLVAFLDPDDYWFPDKLERQLRVFRDHPEIDLLFGDSMMIDVRGDPTGSYFDQLHFRTEAAAHFDRVEASLYVARPSYFAFSALRWTGIQTTGVMIRKSALDRLDELFPVHVPYGEDNDVWWRIFLNGRIAYLDEGLHAYRQHDAGMTRNVAKVTLGRVRSHARNYARGQHLLDAAERRGYARRIAAEYFHLGWQSRTRGDGAAARDAYLASLRWSFSPKTLLAYLKSYLPRRRRGRAA